LAIQGAIDTNARPNGRVLADVDQSQNTGGPPKPKIGEALDHSYHLGSITTSANLHQIIPARLEASWVTCQVKVTFNDSAFNGSYGMKHYSDLALQILQRASQQKSVSSDTPTLISSRQFIYMQSNQKEALLKYVPAVLFIHKKTLLQNIAALVAFIELLPLHVCVNNRNAPYGSWVNSTEHCMNLLNLVLAHQYYARDECAMQEHMFKLCTSMKAVRDLGMRDEVVREEWAECISIILYDIGTRMSQLFLKEEPVDVAPISTDDNVNVLKELMIGDVSATVGVTLWSCSYIGGCQ
jgi:hypothetical protein